MKHLDPVVFSADQCRNELAELHALLAAEPDLKEAQDILPFFRARRHLSVFIGSREPDLVALDRIAFEFDLFGDFVCDLVIGDSVTKTYGFVEFEDGGPTSLFVQRGAKATPEWSPRFERAFSQVVDWFYKLDDMEKTDEFEARFGSRSVQYFGLLVIGRSGTLAPREQRRLAWRQERIVVNSRHVRCLTFDELAAALSRQITHYPAVSQTGDLGV
jgi:hypothetical protein